MLRGVPRNVLQAVLAGLLPGQQRPELAQSAETQAHHAGGGIRRVGLPRDPEHRQRAKLACAYGAHAALEL